MHLVINSYGATLQKENDLFVITTPEGKQNIPPEKLRSISISKAARITSDAVLLAIKHEIDILFVNDNGMPAGRVWSVQYGSISSIRKAQLQFLYSPLALIWVKELLVEKINNQIALLLALQPDSSVLPQFNIVRFAINGIKDHKTKISNVEGECLSDVAASLRGWEGAAGKKYFSAISALLPTEFRFESRTRQPAIDKFNSLLNYAYGILYGKVEGALIKAGIDPYCGIFHRDEYNRPALVFDIIEKYRIWMDYVVVQLCTQQAIPNDCFEIDSITGAYKIESLGKRILIQSVNDYLAEIININGIERSRQTHIDLNAHELAKTFTKEFELL
jgi:CRISPR-associated protein Cas1